MENILEHRVDLKAKTKDTYLTKVANWASYFALVYSKAIPTVVYRSTLSLLLDPRGALTFGNRVLDAKDFHDDDPVLGSMDVADFLPSSEKVDIKLTGAYYDRRTGGTHSLAELSTLAYIVQAAKAKTIFEIGTFLGRTTRLFALNTSADASIITLDVPQEMAAHSIGIDYKGTPEETKITQVYGDSRSFNYAPYKNTCDFVWVDACHDYEFVKNDTERAFELCKPGGLIGWHDYRHTSWWCGVTKYLRELRSSCPGIKHMRGTTIALYRKP